MTLERQKARLRCAVYTRVSSDAGLEQDFNSLDNQREAAEAYVKSQAHEGSILHRRFRARLCSRRRADRACWAPEIVSNLCFGGPLRNRLYVTAQTSLYAIYLNTHAANWIAARFGAAKSMDANRFHRKSSMPAIRGWIGEPFDASLVPPATAKPPLYPCPR